MPIIRKNILSNSRYLTERKISKLSKSQYIGNGIILCNILGGKKFFVLGCDYGLAPHLIFDGFWEFWLTKYFAMSIAPGDVVFDVGANLGYYTILAADLVTQTGQVVAVEPNPEIFWLLTKNVEVNGYMDCVEAHNFALSNTGEKGTLPFFVPAGEPKNGRFIGKSENVEFLQTKGVVQDVKLGDLSVENFDRVDFIKIDVEGAEIAVLNHLRPIIERFNPKIVCEVNFRRGYTYTDVQNALGTDRELHFLDFNSKVLPLTKEMSETERAGDDWLICYGG